MTPQSPAMITQKQGKGTRGPSVPAVRTSVRTASSIGTR